MATNILALGLVIDAIFGIGLGWGIWLGMGDHARLLGGRRDRRGDLHRRLPGRADGVRLRARLRLHAAGRRGDGGDLPDDPRLRPAFLGPWGHLTPLAALSFFFVFGLGSLGQPHVIHKFYMLRDPQRLKWYPLLVTSALMLTMLLYFGVGVVAVKALVVGASSRRSARPTGDADLPAPLHAGAARGARLLRRRRGDHEHGQLVHEHRRGRDHARHPGRAGGRTSRTSSSGAASRRC
jgi:hypothetical protein